MALTRVTKLLLFAFLLGILFETRAQAQTINAASCSSTDVQSAFNAVTSSTITVNIPAGTCHWTTQVTLTVPAGSTSLSILGAGSLTTIGGGDATVIVDDFASVNPDLVLVTGSASSFLRFAGFTFQGGTTGNGGQTKFNGMINIYGLSQNFRLDHNHFLKMVGSGAGLRSFGWLYGVMDHNLCDSSGNNNCFRLSSGAHWNGDANGNGDMAFADFSYMGTNQAIFLEDNIINAGYINDCDSGTHQVIRHNTLNNTNIQAHEMANDQRGCRVTEIYQNVFSGMPTSITIRSGTGVAWGNSGTIPAGVSFLEMDLDRANTQHSFGGLPSTKDWGYCGTQATGTVTSSWDQADSTSTGYACLDQPGRGKGDLLTGFFPVGGGSGKINSVSGVASWPRDALDPWYVFANTVSPNSSVFSFSVSGSGCFIATCVTPVFENQDYYQTVIPFTGATGTGSGSLPPTNASAYSGAPSCTAGNPALTTLYNVSGQTPGVGYWDTSNNTLYVCTATNTWSAYYTPYAYPHPLTLGSGSGNLPAPPTGLSVTVH